MIHVDWVLLLLLPLCLESPPSSAYEVVNMLLNFVDLVDVSVNDET